MRLRRETTIPKTARRFLNRNQWKLAVYERDETGKAMLKRAKIARKVLENEATKEANKKTKTS